MKSKWKLFFPCYFAFFVNGAMVLLVGAILPYLIEEAGISYSVAGGLLSAFASDQSNVQVVYMDAPHDLYHYQSNAIVSRIKEFLENN